MPTYAIVADLPQKTASNGLTGTGCPLGREPREFPFTSLQMAAPTGIVARQDALEYEPQSDALRWLLVAEPTATALSPTSFSKLFVCPHSVLASSQDYILDTWKGAEVRTVNAEGVRRFRDQHSWWRAPF